MSERGQDSDNLEGEPYGLIEFKIDTGSSALPTYQIDCNLATPLIGGLKEDFEDMFGVPKEQQKWYIEETLLSDDNTLLESGVDKHADLTEIKVVRT